jgi:hypothetical protein
MKTPAKSAPKPSCGPTPLSLPARLVKTTLTAWWTLPLLLAPVLSTSGCKTPPAKVVIIPADRKITYLAPGTTNSNTGPGYFVPSARMQEILRALAQQTNYLHETP